MAEGGFYHTLNTYDRARFTFSFMQFGAHVPEGDFVRYLRKLLKLPLAVEYFPDLTLENNRITRVTDHRPDPLESDQTTEGLLDYLNPSLREVEDTEVIQAAKFIHWVQHDPLHKDAQVETAISNRRDKMVQYARKYALDGKSDIVCLVVADIRHQGRAKDTSIIHALQSPDGLTPFGIAFVT